MNIYAELQELKGWCKYHRNIKLAIQKKLNRFKHKRLKLILCEQEVLVVLDGAVGMPASEFLLAANQMKELLDAATKTD